MSQDVTTPGSIDLRSDLCTVPTAEMWEAMRAAELGWATYGEDASVNELCERVAELLGKPAGLWVPTCGMANLVALLTFCERGDAVVLESSSHVLTSEAMGIVEIARLQPRSLFAADGRMDPTDVDVLVEESRAILLVLENTHTRAGGTVLSVEETEGLADAARRHDCRVHIDGARLVNAAVALDVPLAALAKHANSVAFSLNKGLSAPMGTVLVDVSGTGLASYDLLALLEAEGVRAMERDTARLRFVTHRLISDEDVAAAASVVADVVDRHAVPPVELPEVDGLDELDGLEED